MYLQSENSTITGFSILLLQHNLDCRCMVFQPYIIRDTFTQNLHELNAISIHYNNKVAWSTHPEKKPIMPVWMADNNGLCTNSTVTTELFCNKCGTDGLRQMACTYWSYSIMAVMRNGLWIIKIDMPNKYGRLSVIQTRITHTFGEFRYISTFWLAR